MITFKRTNSSDANFQKLVHLLDENLALKNGDKNEFFAKFNKTNFIDNVVVAFDNNKAVACGALKKYDSNTIEIKRMFVLAEYRGKAIGYAVLTNLEKWAKELNYSKTILETGKQMKEAIYLYQKSGYEIIENYEPYKEEKTSVCFAKII